MDYRWWTLVAVVTALALDLLDITILNVAIPHLMAEFGVGIGDIQWVVTAYLVAMGVVIPATADLADNFGTKRIFLASVILFTLGSFLCGVSWNLDSLIAFRVIQGIGGGMIMPLGISIVFRTCMHV